MTTISSRIAAIVKSEYAKLPVDRYPTEETLAQAIIDKLGLIQTTSGQYATRVTLDDDELDRAGFTYHRR